MTRSRGRTCFHACVAGSAASIATSSRLRRPSCWSGIGVNVNEAQLPEEVDRPETSLPVETGREIDRADLVAELLEQLERGYDEWVSGARG